MSLFNLFGGDDSSSHATNTQSTTSHQQGQSGVSGAAIIGQGNTINISQDDQGAIAAGATLGIDALKANQNVTGAALDFADAENNRAQFLMQQGLNAGTAALLSAFGFGRDALDNERQAENNANDTILEALHVGTDASQNAMQNYTSEVNKLVGQTAASNDARVQTMATYAIVAAVILGVAPMFFGRKK